ncbi:hypothetical protein EXIGLDRAFT_771633 [Exidia glandulosa HHB12029]|uniref:Uncharacterized protein n=1 Tax=Exidia glandulosa HHB12029 TaxID=1314781 RepID=A0A165FV53_EXIGL|nr:hypothetical protein EXIGLDRAFT_771633 [Exidia glandulosa HHB12029]
MSTGFEFHNAAARSRSATLRELIVLEASMLSCPSKPFDSSRMSLQGHDFKDANNRTNRILPYRGFLFGTDCTEVIPVVVPTKVVLRKHNESLLKERPAGFLWIDNTSDHWAAKPPEKTWKKTEIYQLRDSATPLPYDFLIYTEQGSGAPINRVIYEITNGHIWHGTVLVMRSNQYDVATQDVLPLAERDSELVKEIVRVYVLRY